MYNSYFLTRTTQLFTWSACNGLWILIHSLLLKLIFLTNIFSWFCSKNFALTIKNPCIPRHLCKKVSHFLCTHLPLHTFFFSKVSWYCVSLYIICLGISEWNPQLSVFYSHQWLTLFSMLPLSTLPISQLSCWDCWWCNKERTEMDVVWVALMEVDTEDATQG